MTRLGIGVTVLGALLTCWSLAGVLDRHTRSEDDWPFLWFSLLVLAFGIGLVILT